MLNKNLTDFETLMFKFVQRTIFSDFWDWTECNPKELRGIIGDIHNGLSFLTLHKDIILDEDKLEKCISSYKLSNSLIEDDIKRLKNLRNSSKLIDFNEIKDSFSTIENRQSDIELNDFFINLLEECSEYSRYLDKTFKETSPY